MRWDVMKFEGSGEGQWESELFLFVCSSVAALLW